MPRLLLLTFFLLSWGVVTARAATVSDTVINMDLNFHQKLLLVSGKLDNQKEEVILTLTGPDMNVNLWQKKKFWGIWVNGQKKTFEEIPSFYFWATSDMTLSSRLANWQKYILSLGDNALSQNFYNQLKDDNQTRRDYSKGLLQSLINKKVYFAEPARIFKNNGKFYLPIVIYPETPIGNYHLTVYYLVDNQIVRTEQMPIIIEKKGLSSVISNFAEKNSLLYGVAAIIMAVLFGYGSSVIYEKFVMAKLKRQPRTKKKKGNK